MLTDYLVSPRNKGAVLSVSETDGGNAPNCLARPSTAPAPHPGWGRFWTLRKGRQTEREVSMAESALKGGDRVRLIAETLAWRAEKTLQGQIGEIIERR